MVTVLCQGLITIQLCVVWPLNFSVTLQVVKSFSWGTKQLLSPSVDKLNLRVVCPCNLIS